MWSKNMSSQKEEWVPSVEKNNKLYFVDTMPRSGDQWYGVCGDADCASNSLVVVDGSSSAFKNFTFRNSGYMFVRQVVVGNDGITYIAGCVTDKRSYSHPILHNVLYVIHEDGQGWSYAWPDCDVPYGQAIVDPNRAIAGSVYLKKGKMVTKVVSPPFHNLTQFVLV